MSSNYSSLKIELMGTGEQPGQWGNVTNVNLGTAIEQAIVGMATLDTAKFTANVCALTLANTNAAQDARAVCLNITATLSAAGTVEVPAIQKPYIVINGSSGGYAVTVKVSGQTGISVPNGKAMFLYNNGTDVVEGVNYVAYALAAGSASSATTATTATNVTGGTATSMAISNSTIAKRIVVIADGTSITMNADTTDIATQANTQTAGTLTINAPTGTPANGQQLMLRLRSTNVQTFSWNSVFAGSSDVPLPTASSGATLYDYMGFQYNSTASKWQLLAKNFGF